MTVPDGAEAVDLGTIKLEGETHYIIKVLDGDDVPISGANILAMESNARASLFERLAYVPIASTNHIGEAMFAAGEGPYTLFGQIRNTYSDIVVVDSRIPRSTVQLVRQTMLELLFKDESERLISDVACDLIREVHPRVRIDCRSDSLGSYRVDTPEGLYSLELRDPRFTLVSDGAPRSAGRSFRVSGDAYNATIVLRKQKLLTIRVVDEAEFRPIPEYSVRVIPASLDPKSFTLRVDDTHLQRPADGVLRLPLKSDESVFVLVKARGYRQASTLVVRPMESTDVVLSRQPRWKLAFVNQLGRAISNCRVELRYDAPFGGSAGVTQRGVMIDSGETNAQGTWITTGWREGLCSVWVHLAEGMLAKVGEVLFSEGQGGSAEFVLDDCGGIRVTVEGPPIMQSVCIMNESSTLIPLPGAYPEYSLESIPVGEYVVGFRDHMTLGKISGGDLRSIGVPVSIAKGRTATMTLSSVRVASTALVGVVEGLPRGQRHWIQCAPIFENDRGSSQRLYPSNFKRSLIGEDGVFEYGDFPLGEILVWIVSEINGVEVVSWSDRDIHTENSRLRITWNPCLLDFHPDALGTEIRVVAIESSGHMLAWDARSVIVSPQVPIAPGRYSIESSLGGDLEIDVEAGEVLDVATEYLRSRYD